MTRPTMTRLTAATLAVAFTITASATHLAAQDRVLPRADNMSTVEDRTVMSVAGDVLTDTGPIAMDPVPVEDPVGLNFAAIGEPIITLGGERVGAVSGVTSGADGTLARIEVALDPRMPGNLDSIVLSARGAERTQDGLVLTLSRDEVLQMIEANAS